MARFTFRGSQRSYSEEQTLWLALSLAQSLVYISQDGQYILYCRLWNKPWGLPKISRTRKANRRKQNNLILSNEAVLQEAKAREPKQNGIETQQSDSANAKPTS